MRSTLWTLVVAMLGCSLLAACGDAGERAALTASVSRSRAAQARELLNVLLSNPNDEPVQVRTLALDDDRFAPVPLTKRVVTIPARADGLLVPIALGPARCLGVLDEPSVIAGGVSIAVDAAGRRVLDGLVEDACVLAAIERSASVAFVGEGSPVSPVAVDVVLRLVRRSGGRAVTVDAVGSNVIFTASSPDLPATLGADDDDLDVTVRLSADRCEPHALAESKKTFLLPVWIALDDGDPSFVELTVGGGARAALERALDDGCAAGRS